MRLFVLFLFTLLSLFAQNSHPQGKKNTNESDDSQPEPSLLERMTVTAERKPIAIKETPSQITVIDADQIEKELVSDVEDLIRYEPGVFIEHDGNRYNLGGFNIRGIGENRVRTEIDGVRTAEQFGFGPFTVHPYYIDVDTLKSVEILRGAASSLYGSDALGGLVSFQTKDPEDWLGPMDRSFFQVKTGYDTENQGSHLGVTAAGRLGKTSIMGQGTFRDRENWENQGAIDTDDFNRTEPNPQDGESKQFLFKLVHRPNPNATVKFSAEFFDSEVDTLIYSDQGDLSIFGIPTHIAANTANDTQERYRFSVAGDWNPGQLAMADVVTWKFYNQASQALQLTSENRSQSFGPQLVRIQRTGTVSFDQEITGLNLFLTKAWTTQTVNFQLSYGASMEESDFEQFRDRRDLDLDTQDPDAYQGTLIFPTRYFPNSTQRQTGAFAQFEALFWDDRIRIVPGARFDRYELDPDQNDRIFLDSTQTESPPEGLDDDAISLKFGFNVAITKNVAVTGQFSEGFRAPPYSSVNSGFTNPAGGYQTLSSPDLDPEESDNREIGFKLFDARGSAQIAYFDNRFKNFIQDSVFVGISSTGLALFQAQNVDRVQIDGFELSGDLKISESWTMRAAFADIEGTNTQSDEPIDSIEPGKTVIGFAYKSTNPYGGEITATLVNGKSAADAPSLTSGDPFLPDSYQLFDLTLYWRPTHQWQWNLGAFNLGNETYWRWSQVRGRNATDPLIDRYSAPGRSFSLNGKFRW